MCSDLCQCICFLYQQTLPAEVLSACSCTLLNKVWTLTFGVQLANQNGAPTNQTFCQIIMPNPQSNTFKLLCKQTDIKHLCHGVCETFPINSGRLLKRITWKNSLHSSSHTCIPTHSLILSTPSFIICLTGIRVVLECASVAKATAAGGIVRGETDGEQRGKREGKQ